MVQGWVCAQLGVLSNILPGHDADSIRPDGCKGQGKTMKEFIPLHRDVTEHQRLPKVLLDYKPSQEHSSRYSLPVLFDI